MGLADERNCVCGDIQSASHILHHSTVLALRAASPTPSTDDPIKYLCNSSF